MKFLQNLKFRSNIQPARIFGNLGLLKNIENGFRGQKFSYLWSNRICVFVCVRRQGCVFSVRRINVLV